MRPYPATIARSYLLLLPPHTRGVRRRRRCCSTACGTRCGHHRPQVPLHLLVVTVARYGSGRSSAKAYCGWPGVVRVRSDGNTNSSAKRWTKQKRILAEPPQNTAGEETTTARRRRSPPTKHRRFRVAYRSSVNVVIVISTHFSPPPSRLLLILIIFNLFFSLL